MRAVCRSAWKTVFVGVKRVRLGTPRVRLRIAAVELASLSLALGSVGLAAAQPVAHPAAAPNLSGIWNLVETAVGTTSTADATYTFTETAPDTYTVNNGVGWETTNVTLAGTPGESVSIYFCNNPTTISETDQSACIVSIGGWWIEDFTLGPVTDGRYTASGTIQEYAPDGSTVGQVSDTFTGTGPLAVTPSVFASVSPKSARALVHHRVTIDVKVLAGPVAVTDATLGIDTATRVATVLRNPKGLEGFDLGAGRSRTFKFVLEGERPGKAHLNVTVTGSAAGLQVSHKAAATLQVRQ